MRYRIGLLISAALAATLAAGCDSQKLPVTGKVTVKGGGPLPGGMVVFAPVAGGTSGGARGYIREDGTFTLSTERPEDGSFAGKYRVLVVPPSKKGGEEVAAAPPPIDPRYAEFDGSGLEVEVTPERHHFEFTLDPPARKKK